MCKRLCNTVGNVFRLIIVGATALALTMEIWTAASCELVDLPDGSEYLTAGLFHLGGEDGTCEDAIYETDDAVVKGARTTLIFSILAGFAAGIMITFEWLLCQVCCAGVLEGCAFLLAWTSGTATFMFYGADLCISNVTGTDGDDECGYTQNSAMMTVAIICYFGCGVLLCFTPQPEPIFAQ